MSNENRSPTSFRTVSATAALLVVMGLGILALGHAEMAQDDSRVVAAMAPATDAEANRPAEAVYLPTRR